MNYLKHQKYKNHKQWNIKLFLKVQNSSLELEKDFKAIVISINDADKFKKFIQKILYKEFIQRTEHLQKTLCAIGMTG